MQDWTYWLNSNNTIIAIKTIEEAIDELKDAVTNGSHILEKDTNKIALDVTYSLGQIEGLKLAIELIKDIAEEKSSDN
jgi:hypothetical protein